MKIFDFEPLLLEKAKQAEEMCKEAFEHFEAVATHNGEKVLKAFVNNRVSEHHLRGSNGYGYGDDGRDTLDRIFAECFEAESALVRHNFINGTHAITVALFGVLRSGDRIISVTGKPYDTLHGVISGDSNGSLKEYGIEYSQVDLLTDYTPDFAAIKQTLLTHDDCKAVFIQRSRGYSLRKPLTVGEISEIVKVVREIKPETVIIVDNCYGEFCERIEPTSPSIGADLIVGSLIKNPGGGIAETGGYIAGKSTLVEQCACRLNAPGIGSEAGCSLNQNRFMYLGFFYAPEITANALKTSAFASALFGLLGYECSPAFGEKAFIERTDLILALNLGGEQEICAFCEGIQAGSPVDSFITPEPWEMPGYQHKVIMAAGAFTSGASIELSADAPIREPFTVFLQGGLTFPSGRLGILSAANRLLLNKS
ncbi:MAG: methionine gamma-lyase family protein [Oscillospiraceae bacterium]|nr:methionine gamma-lyase family protein [Oscillospiraceae bacterium]